ncbi:uncharacterized protein [Scyliorhinus torazame]|uniref:uncharacterized protein n=1 Tax=Scyliorhinus torazame TaxID=75743 RepID=UPI003B5A668D
MFVEMINFTKNLCWEIEATVHEQKAVKKSKTQTRLDIKEKIEIQRETGEQETEEGADDWMNGEWETVETRDSQTSSFDRKEAHRALVDAEGTLNNPRPCSKNGVSGHAVLSGSDVQDLEASGKALKYCSFMSKLNNESVLVASDEISDQLSATEDHLPLKDRNPLGLELTCCPNTVDDDSIILEKNVCDEEEIKCSSAADTETKSLAMSVKLQEQSTDEATEKLQSALITDNAEMLQDGQETSAPACTIGNGYSGLHPEKYREELSDENLRNDIDFKDEMPGDSAVALKPSTKISPDDAILGITNTIIGMMV